MSLSLLRKPVSGNALLNHWLDRMAAESYRSAQFIFAWSFKPSGRCDTFSAEDFFHAALAWFGDPNPRLERRWTEAKDWPT